MSSADMPPEQLMKLASDHPPIAEEARRELLAGGEAAIPMLLSGLEDARLGLMAHGRILRILGELRHPGTVPAIVAALHRALGTGNPIERDAAMEALATFQTGETLAELVALFHHPDPAVAAYAAVLAGHTRLMAALAPLQALLASQDKSLRYAAVQGLIRLDAVQARQVLGEHLGRESDEEVRALIVSAGIAQSGRTW